MSSKRCSRQRPMQAVRMGLGACALTAIAVLGAAPAIADPASPTTPETPTTPADEQFLNVVKQLNIPMPSQDETIQAGHKICEQVEAGKVQPARTVRGILAGLTSNGLQKGVAVHLIWGAVDSYCPQYRSLVGH